LKIAGKSVVVTGGASGIGRALAERFAAEGARGVVVADINAEWAQKVAGRIGGLGVGCDVGDPDSLDALVKQAEGSFGPIDLFCSNAGFTDPAPGDLSQPAEAWRRIVDVNLMAHVWAARAVVPSMLARGQGYLLQTVSAAGLLTQLGSAPYAVTKHAALALAEWLSITYGDQGIRVSALCPQGVRTDMLRRAEFGGGSFLLETALEPEQVAEAVVQGLEAERFLILPHPEVAEYFQRKAGDYERWLRGMRRLQANMQPLEPQL
jgi:NAD(P)-dependent dehydrogenase (short-subunit alcohol dehydrogenase family)